MLAAALQQWPAHGVGSITVNAPGTARATIELREGGGSSLVNRGAGSSLLFDGVTGELFQTTLTPSFEHIKSWIGDLPGPVAVAYEAGPTGFGLYRQLSAAGIRCEVVAPSKLQKPAGDRVKTDAKDAVHLARLLRLDEIVAVAIPTIDQEAARDLVRAREDCRGDLMAARHRLSKLLLRHGIVYYGGAAWTAKHDQWLRLEALPQLTTRATRLTFDSDYEAVLAIKARRDRLDTVIEEMAAESEFTPIVRRLGCLRGICGGREGEVVGGIVDDWLVQLVERQHRHGRIGLEQLLDPVFQQRADDHVRPFLNRLLVKIAGRLALGVVEVQGKLPLIFLIRHQHTVADGGAVRLQAAGLAGTTGGSMGP